MVLCQRKPSNDFVLQSHPLSTENANQTTKSNLQYNP